MPRASKKKKRGLPALARGARRIPAAKGGIRAAQAQVACTQQGLKLAAHLRQVFGRVVRRVDEDLFAIQRAFIDDAEVLGLHRPLAHFATEPVKLWGPYRARRRGVGSVPGSDMKLDGRA